jgi:hypothetical protein
VSHRQPELWAGPGRQPGRSPQPLNAKNGSDTPLSKFIRSVHMLYYDYF